MQCVARDGMSTKDLLQVPFVFSCIDSNDSLFLCTLSSLILVQVGRVATCLFTYASQNGVLNSLQHSGENKLIYV